MAHLQQVVGRRLPHLPRQQRRQAGRRPGQGRQSHPEAVDSEKPPLHMPLGARAYALARTKIAEFTQDLDAWEAVAKATDYE